MARVAMLRKRRTRMRPAATTALVLSGALLAAAAQGTMTAAQGPAPAGPVEAIEIRPDFYMLAGAGGNVAVQIGPIGVILVDAGSAAAAGDVLAAVRRLTPKPIRYIINTAADADHVGANGMLSKAGATILGRSRGNSLSDDVINNGGAASVLAHEAVLARMSGPAALPSAVWPTKVYVGRGYAMSLNDEGIQILHQPAAHSDGDSIVHFRRSDVIVAGDVVNVDHFPVIDLAAGGSIDGEIAALNRLIDLTIPPFPLTWQGTARTFVIPGHGRPIDFADLVDYRNMVVIVRSVVADMVRRGMTLAEVRAADPTRAYRARYGVESGTWTTDAFVEAVFAGVSEEGAHR